MIGILAITALVGTGLYLGLAIIANRRATPATGPILPTPAGQDVPDATERLSVLTWNIGYAALGKDADLIVDNGRSLRALTASQIAVAAEGIAEYLVSDACDVICLQENANAGFLTRGVPLRRILDRALAALPGAYWGDMRTVMVPPFLRIDHGMSVHARKRLAGVDAVLLPADRTYHVGVLKKHYGMLVSRFPIKGSDQKWVVFNIHLSAFDVEGGARRDQLKALMRRAEEEYEKGHFVVIAGDWNMRLARTEFDHQADAELRLWATDFPKEALPAQWQIAIDPECPTVRSLNAAYEPGVTYTTIIDGFAYSPNVALAWVQTTSTGFAITDHHPVRAEFFVRG